MTKRFSGLNMITNTLFLSMHTFISHADTLRARLGTDEDFELWETSLRLPIPDQERLNARGCDPDSKATRGILTVERNQGNSLNRWRRECQKEFGLDPAGSV
ncbi:hypothetical protein CVT26_009175 [Gymnopilus dilepis]|uniref:Uncharacterized protein n=1 Tax=Gymnopilus dilepis TaxID=231916 RepID=A0A409Y9W4_9AGAR|nr:hypothetical protein CVT26_009175 [Gymnopilus dilepis]